MMAQATLRCVQIGIRRIVAATAFSVALYGCCASAAGLPSPAVQSAQSTSSGAALSRFSDYVTTPTDLPPVTLTVARPEADEGCIFLAPYERVIGGTRYAPYLLIVDDRGELVYYRRVIVAAEDFKRQDNGTLSFTIGGTYTHQVMDSSYEVVELVTAVNGYRADFHDLQISPDDHVLLLIYEGRQMDLSEIVPGGRENATVVGCRIQELDEQREVVFEWSSFDHIPITDTTVSLLDRRIDYIHCNSVDRDWDGHLLLSSRALDEVTKIDGETGEIIWRLGGKRNQFQLVNAIGAADVAFVMQHDARRADNGNITLYDNHTGAGNYSRALEYHLDEVNKVATLVWEYRNSPDIQGHIMGNVQRLPNGNTLIGWGSGHPAVTEVMPDGTKVFELVLPEVLQSYRAFRFPWTGKPDTEPALVVSSQVPTITLTYSWNGATELAAYRVYGDRSDYPTHLITVQPKSGFETTTVITDMLDGPYNFRVVPVDKFGMPMLPDIDPGPSLVFLPLLRR